MNYRVGLGVFFLTLVQTVGCQTPGERILSRAGHHIRDHAYVACTAKICIKNQTDESETVHPMIMLFGPTNRIRIEIDDRIFFYDGEELGRHPDKDGQLWTRKAEHNTVPPIMTAGMTIKNDNALTLAVAREEGMNWWRKLYGSEAVAKLRDVDQVEGNDCYVIDVSGTEKDGEFRYWIDKDSGHFRRLKRVEHPTNEIVEMTFDMIRFPRYISDEQFRGMVPIAFQPLASTRQSATKPQ